MDQTFKTIADLFAVAQPDEVTVKSPTRKKEGKTAEESDQLGRQCLQEGDIEAAIKHFKTAVSQRDATDIASRLDLAGAYDYADQAPQAYRQYQQALRLQSDAAEPLLGISDLMRRHGRFRDSVVSLEEAIKREPANAYLRIKLAEVLRDAGERKRALTAAQQAIVAKPDEAFYHYWIGDLLIQMERYEEALDSLRAAIELSPGDDFLYLRAAVAFWRVGRKQEAIKAIRLASDLDPAKHFYHGLLGILLEENNLPEEASQESDRASQMDRYDHDTLARVLDEMGIEA